MAHLILGIAIVILAVLSFINQMCIRDRVCGYVYANAGEGESTQDLVFGGQHIIAENGNCLRCV